MYEHLETAENPQDLRRVVIDPVTRVEGHGKVTLLLDDDNRVRQARLHIVEFRGFERFIQGRPYWELPVLVQRLCGICPVSHHLAAAKAVDQLVGVDKLTPTAEKLRRLLHLGQTLQSHALHFFHLATPDLLFGFDSDASRRNIVAVLQAYPDVGLEGVRMRKYGQEVIRAITGKRIHGTGAIPGGMNKALSVDERDELLRGIDEVIGWTENAVRLIKDLFLSNVEYHQHFAFIRSNFMSLIRPDGALELYHGGLRARDDSGATIFDHVDYRSYTDYLREEVRPWSYMKFPHIVSLGKNDGWYRVGPLARLNNCEFISTPLAERARQEFASYGAGVPVHGSLGFHWARMIEALHSAEGIKELLTDPDITGTDLVVKGDRRPEGIGVIEAPRGTLFHHYIVDDDDIVVKANLIVSTTNNNQAMNESIRQVADRYFDGRELTEGLLNHIEVAIRAYDPCLSCATHALGKMPLKLELVDAGGAIVDRLVKSGDGDLARC
ncbi:MAG: Ni/Fe hydrogenase subunit alpha [Methylotetracoccus sp.]